MSEFSTELLVIAFLIFMNSILAMSEVALISARKARLQSQSNDGNMRARLTLRLLENPNQFLSVIQIGITLIDVLTGAIGGVTLARFLSNELAKIPVLAPYSETLGLVVVVLTLTYLSLILGELVPKRLALHNPERIASLAAGPMLFTSRILSPIVHFLSASTELVLRIIGFKSTQEAPVTEEEIHVLLDQGTQAGVFDAAEQDMVQGVFRLHDRRVSSLMTPRTEISWLDINDSPDDLRLKIASSPYSRFPVCQGNLDNVIGLVKARDLLVPSLEGEPLQLKKCVQPALYIPESAFASRALEIFKENGRELVLVIDEFGGVQGLLTINDIIEEIVGDIDIGEPQATQRQDGSWLLDGMLSVEDFKKIFRMREMPAEQNFETLGGFLMMSLGRIPRTTDYFEWQGLRFEIMDMDGRRVDKVLVTTIPIKAAIPQNE